MTEYTIDPGVWQLYWGVMPLPKGATVLGIINVSVNGRTLRKGALLKLSRGLYVVGNAGGVSGLIQSKVEEILELNKKG